MIVPRCGVLDVNIIEKLSDKINGALQTHRHAHPVITLIKANAVFDRKYPAFSIQDSECGSSCFLLMLLQPKRLMC